jgi:uncharacterized protein (TIGR02145 family)
MQKIKLLLALIFFYIRLTSVPAQTVIDSDGNKYPVITIGKQIWIAENLKTTKFNDGKAIPLVTSDNAWKTIETPAYCWLNNDIANKEIYGALYNWYSVNTKKLCPKGWHVPSKTEWEDMIIFLGDENIAGAKLKEAGQDHWKNSILISTNEFGFTALPGGLRLMEGNFPEFASSYAVWWSTTEFSKIAAWNRGLFFSSSKVYGGNDNKKNGFSVRCIKD